MSWLDHHRTSERLAAGAEVARLSGSEEPALALYRQAAAAEAAAVEALDPAKTRTFGISAVSAVALFYKAREYELAERHACKWLSMKSTPPEAVMQLRSLLQAAWCEKARRASTIDFAPDQVLVSVSGGVVVEGGAPLNLVVSKVNGVQSMFHRTVELLDDRPFRRRGPPPAEIREQCRAWLFQTPPGSYQFAVGVQMPRQGDLFKEHMLAPRIIDRFMAILSAEVEGSDQALAEIAPDESYRSAFSKMARNLAPAPKRSAFERLEFSTFDRSIQVTLDADVRTKLSNDIRSKAGQEETGRHRTLSGVLRALHLDKDWLEVAVAGELVRVVGVHEQVDDILGPMVNGPVEVRVADDGRTMKFLDIESREDAGEQPDPTAAPSSPSGTDRSLLPPPGPR